jgi:hypothetical protein
MEETKDNSRLSGFRQKLFDNIEKGIATMLNPVDEAKAELQEWEDTLTQKENQLNARERTLDQRANFLERKEQSLIDREENVDGLSERLLSKAQEMGNLIQESLFGDKDYVSAETVVLTDVSEQVQEGRSLPPAEVENSLPELTSDDLSPRMAQVMALVQTYCDENGGVFDDTNTSIRRRSNNVIPPGTISNALYKLKERGLMTVGNPESEDRFLRPEIRLVDADKVLEDLQKSA